MHSQRYQQLIADLKSDYRPQREWGSGKGILMVVGHFLVGIAGGAWAFSSFYGVPAGLVVAFVLGVLGGIVHLFFLGRPERAFNMMRHWRTSWVSRGFVGLALFIGGGGIYLPILLLHLQGPAWSALSAIGEVIAAAGAITIIGYMGFCYSASKAIPFWHSPLHPALYIAYAARGGIATLLIIAAAQGTAPGARLLQLWVGVTAVVALFFAFELHGALASGNSAAKRSARDILAGRLALAFYGGTLAIGLVVPALLVGTANAQSPVVMAIIGLASAAGDFFMKLSTVRAGVYLPLVVPQRRRQRAG